jgi:uracil-DNA glycosylase family 4
LYEYRTSNGYFPVIGQGSHQASMIFIGEAPGENEAKTAVPFCGAAGKFLDKLFESIGLHRPDVYVTNIVKDRPPNNRDPLPAEIELYAPFLDRQIEIIKPKVLVTLGRFSMEYVMKRYGFADKVGPISKIHGQVFSKDIPDDADSLFGSESEDMKVVALYHPASALYNPNNREILFKDFEVLKQFI